MARLPSVLRALASCDAEKQKNLDYACCAIAVRAARQNISIENDVLARRVDNIIVLLDLAATGHGPTLEAWYEARMAVADLRDRSVSPTGIGDRIVFCACSSAVQAARIHWTALQGATREASLSIGFAAHKKALILAETVQQQREAQHVADVEQRRAWDRMAIAMFDTLELAATERAMAPMGTRK